jgi:N-acetylglucosamine-6-phosphate deacetylase
MARGIAKQVRGRHYRTGRGVELSTDQGRITVVREVSDAADAWPWIAPGFVDLQSNGYGGQEFGSADVTADKVAEIARRQATFGVTRFLPTVTTGSHDTLAGALRAIDEACRRFADVARVVAGVHLEGPYISPEEGPRGAHPLEHCRRPDWSEFERFQQAAGGRIKLVTLSAEFSESPDFITRAVRSGVVVALGHTSADGAQIRAAVDAGARLSTHLGNGAHRALRRHPNYIWDQLAEDRLMASLIVDGHHLPAEVVKTFVRAKGPQRCILVSDLSGLAGMPPGRYATQLCELEILSDGRLVIAGQDQLLAGASRPIGAGVANVMQFAGVDLATAVRMASHQPAALIGLPAGDLQVGDAADLVLFDLLAEARGQTTQLHVRATVAAGEVVYGRLD